MDLEGKLRKSLIGALLVGKLFISGCSKDDNPTIFTEEPENPIPRIERIVNASKGDTLISNGYKVFIPAGSLQRDAKVTLMDHSYGDNLNVDGLKKVGYGMQVNIESELADTIQVEFPIQNLDKDGFFGTYFSKGEFTPLGPISSNNPKLGYFGSERNPSFNIFIFDRLTQETKLIIPSDFNYSSNEKTALLIHGMGGNQNVFEYKENSEQSFSEFIKSIYNGRVTFFQYPSGKGILENANSLDEKIEEAFGNSDFKIDIIGHSMGGVVGRTYIRNHDSKNRTRKLVTLGSPHNGVSFYILEQSFKHALNNPGWVLINPYASGGKDLIAGSDFLTQLNTSLGPINSTYINISGTKPEFLSLLIPGEDDGLVSNASSNMIHPDFPTHEDVSRIYSRKIALSHTELTKNKLSLFDSIRSYLIENPLLENLVAHYTFDGEVYDVSGNGNDGILYGGEFVEDESFLGKQSLKFNGINDYVLVSDNSSLDLTRFTIYTVFKVPNHEKFNWVFTKGFYYGNYSMTVFDKNQPRFPGQLNYTHQNVDGGNWIMGATKGPVPINEYIHVAVTVEPNFKNVSYLNGILENSSSVVSPLTPQINNGPLIIGGGGYENISSYFDGNMSRLMIFNRILNADEINSLYNLYNNK